MRDAARQGRAEANERGGFVKNPLWQGEDSRDDGLSVRAKGGQVAVVAVWMELALFAGVMVLGQFSPGPDMLLLTRTALRKGARIGLETAAGITCGLAVHSTIAVAGMSVAFERLPWLRTALQWLAAIYLLWLAWGMARECFVAWYSGAIHEVDVADGGRAPFIRGLLCNLLNPKAALFLAAVCAPFLSGHHPSWWPYAIWGIIVGFGIGLWSLWVLLLQYPPLRHRYERSAGLVDGIFGLVLAALAVRLMLGW
jgi:threonine/homoserine/homoserine lactone efflux protein